MSGEVSGRSNRWVSGGSGVASTIGSEPLLVATVTDELRQESPWTIMHADVFVIYSESRHVD